MTLIERSEISLPPPTASDDAEILIDAWREVLGEALANERKQWERQRELIEAQASSIIAKLQARVMEHEKDVDQRVNARLAELKDGKDGDRGEAGPSGEKGDAGERGEKGEPGERGEHGEKGEKGETGQAGEKGQAGDQGERGEQGAAGAQGVAGERGLPGQDGATGKPGQIASVEAFVDGEVHYEGNIVSHRGATYQARCDTAKPPPHDDWACIAARGLDAAMPKIVGTFKEGEPYSFMNIVALSGSSFIARTDDPGPCPGEGWQLIASAGHGKTGKPGPQGDRGEAGQRGPAGAAAPVILGWQIDRDAYTATPIMSDNSDVPALQLRGLFEQFHGEAG
jgi:hypothetical protein